MSAIIESQLEFQTLADIRLRESKVLLDLEMWDGAYYLAGYAVELALKSCIIKTLMATDAFPGREFSRNCYTHDIEKLVELASLKELRGTATAADGALLENWAIARDWSEEKRYHRIEKIESESLHSAVADVEHGVLTWIKSHW